MENLFKKNVFVASGLVLAATFGVSKMVLAEDILQTESAEPTLEERLAKVERQLAIAQEEAAKKNSTSPNITIDGSGVSLKSAKGDYGLRLSFFAQVDGRFYLDHNIDDQAAATAAPALSDSFLLRRVRTTFDVNLGSHVSARFMPEFATADGIGTQASLLDVYADVHFSPAWNLRIGKQKSPSDLERLQSAGASMFVERAFPTEMMPNRDIGVQLFGSVFDHKLSYNLGIFNGTADGRDDAAPNGDSDNRHEIAARIFAEPFKASLALQNLGFGISATHGSKRGGGNNVLPRYRSPAQNQIFNYVAGVEANGTHTRISPQAYWYVGSFGLQTAYVSSKQAVRSANRTVSQDLNHTGYHVSASYLLTGENASYTNAIKPRKALGQGGWGAWEIVGRVTGLDIDDAAFESNLIATRHNAISKATSYGVGVNWYPTAHTKLYLDYQSTAFKDGVGAAGAPRDRNHENVVLLRFQIHN